MKLRWLKEKHWLLITAMGLFSLASCEKQEDNHGCPEQGGCDSAETVPMYGVQQTDFKSMK